MDKAELRKAMKAAKSALNDVQKAEAAKRCFSLVESLEEFKKARSVLLYASLPDELPTDGFLEKWSTLKQIFLPRVNGYNLDILPYRHDTLTKGAFGISEPQGDATVDIRAIDLIIVPGVAFDSDGNRLGRGRGFYDRLLRDATAAKIGVAFDLQVVDRLPAEEHDVAMDYVVTERRITGPLGDPIGNITKQRNT